MIDKTFIGVSKDNIKTVGWHLGVEDQNESLHEFNFVTVPKVMENVNFKDR